MNSDRKRTYLLSTLLAVPPAVLVGLLCNSFLPQPESVPAVVGANDPDVGMLQPQGANQPPHVRLARSLH